MSDEIKKIDEISEMQNAPEIKKEKKKIKCFEKSMLKRPGSPRKRDNTVDFLKIKTYNNQDSIRMQKSI